MKRFVILSFYIFFSVVVLLILMTSYIYPQNNLISWQIAAITVFSAVLFACYTYLWNKFACKNSLCKNNKITISIILVCGILFFGFGMLCNGSLSLPLEDYRVVYTSAMEMATGDDLSFPQYFNQCDFIKSRQPQCCYCHCYCLL